MLGKQWLNRYLRHAGGSTIERCGDRQRKCDGLKKWPFHLFVESLPVMLQVALLLLTCGLCKHMSSINTLVAGVLITLTVLGAVFYLGIVIVGASSYECPFQTPLSTALRRIWKATKPPVTAVFDSIAIGTTSLWLPVLATLHRLWETAQCQILHFILWLPPITHWLPSHHQILPVVQPALQQPPPWLVSLRSLWEDIQYSILRAAPRMPQTQHSSLITLPTSPWLTPTALVTLHNRNAGDVRCISWILWNITDPEALDAAIRLAGTVRWFEDGLNVEPPYDQIVSILKGCFDSAGRVYPGSRDRAYHSGQAALWIHIRALCVSKEFAKRFPFPVVACDMRSSPDPDLRCLLQLCDSPDLPRLFLKLYITDDKATSAYFQWTSNALLCLSWVMQGEPSTFDTLSWAPWGLTPRTLPVNTVLNHLLTSCIFFGLPIEEELLKIQDKR